jgi:hypothetical protein
MTNVSSPLKSNRPRSALPINNGSDFHRACACYCTDIETSCP